jgi:hypothetical protein
VAGLAGDIPVVRILLYILDVGMAPYTGLVPGVPELLRRDGIEHGGSEVPQISEGRRYHEVSNGKEGRAQDEENEEESFDLNRYHVSRRKKECDLVLREALCRMCLIILCGPLLSINSIKSRKPRPPFRARGIKVRGRRGSPGF